MIPTRINGNKNYIPINIVLSICILSLFSCNSTKNTFIKDNYSYSVLLYNQKLGISFKFFGTMKIVDSSLIQKKHLRKIVKGIPELKNKKIIVFLEKKDVPEFETILFYEEIKSATDTITRTKLLLNYSENKCVLYKKSKANKVVYLLLRPSKVKKFGFTYAKSAETLIDNVKFETEELDKTTYSKVFFDIKENNNYLTTRKVLKSNMLNQSRQQKWEQYQFLTTINSFISNNIEYDSLIAKSSSRFQPSIDSLLFDKPTISKEKVIEEIKNLTKNEKVVMLNETHWFPKHRLLAYEMLDGLKENNFNYIAVEAIDMDKDSVINYRSYPSISCGYYLREPNFARFIRKAKSLGFKIVAYDDMESNNRELSQAMNLKKILDEDPNAKIFVYAGVDHILEFNDSKKRMAEIFEEQTDINPLTFNQARIVGNTNEEIVLFRSEDFKKVKGLNTNVDYFVVNNLNTSLENVYKKEVLKDVILKDSKFKNKNLLIRIFDKNEYYKIAFNAIPLFINYLDSEDSRVTIRLPVGKYFISIISDKDEILYNDYLELD